MTQRLVVRNGEPPCQARVTVEGDGLPIIAGFRWEVGHGSRLPTVEVTWDCLSTDLDVEALVMNPLASGVKRIRVTCDGFPTKAHGFVTDLDTGLPVLVTALIVKFSFEHEGFVAWVWPFVPDAVPA